MVGQLPTVLHIYRQQRKLGLPISARPCESRCPACDMHSLIPAVAHWVSGQWKWMNRYMYMKFTVIGWRGCEWTKGFRFVDNVLRQICFLRFGGFSFWLCFHCAEATLFIGLHTLPEMGEEMGIAIKRYRWGKGKRNEDSCCHKVGVFWSWSSNQGISDRWRSSPKC